MLVDKDKVISAQEKLLECKNEQLNNVKSEVESTAQKVVKCVIEDADGSKNLIFFLEWLRTRGAARQQS